ncbi:MAG: ABC transporter ATP-binding protein [Acidobacteriota bacterium]|nr:ABC transporter ATP-binding protein [Acidobacteriota bacterium]
MPGVETPIAAPPSRPYICFDGVAKRYAQRGGSAPASILEGIDLTVQEGEFVSLIGPSGCGKSTMLKLVAGLTPVSAGSIRIEGLTPENAREIVSFIFQDPTLLPWRTVEQNVALRLELEGVTRIRRQEKVASLLELVGLSHAAGSYPRQLSGGMKMRVSIARALSTRPRVLLMDEPFAALDEISRDRLNEEMLRLQAEQGWTAMFVTHSVAEAVFLSHRVLVLSAHPGRIAHEVAVPLPYPRTAETRLTPEFEQVVAHVSRLLRGVHR